MASRARGAWALLRHQPPSSVYGQRGASTALVSASSSVLPAGVASSHIREAYTIAANWVFMDDGDEAHL